MFYWIQTISSWNIYLKLEVFDVISGKLISNGLLTFINYRILTACCQGIKDRHGVTCNVFPLKYLFILLCWIFCFIVQIYIFFKLWNINTNLY